MKLTFKIIINLKTHVPLNSSQFFFAGVVVDYFRGGLDVFAEGRGGLVVPMHWVACYALVSLD